jgi:hypothetical protein
MVSSAAFTDCMSALGVCHACQRCTLILDSFEAKCMCHCLRALVAAVCTTVCCYTTKLEFNKQAVLSFMHVARLTSADMCLQRSNVPCSCMRLLLLQV